MIDDSLSRATGPLLANCIASTLGLPLKSFFTAGDTRRVARQLNESLLRDDQRVWFQSAPQIIELVELFDPVMAQRLFSKYINELKTSLEQPSRLVETVTFVYPGVANKSAFIEVLNDRLLLWGSSDPGLTAISTLSQMKLSSDGMGFPSSQIVTTMLIALNPMTGDARSNELRKDILFANWEPEYGTTLCTEFWTVIQTEHSKGTFDVPLRFTLKVLCEKPEILNHPEGDLIANHLPPALARATNDDDRNLVRDCMITEAAAGSSTGKAATLNSLSSHWQSDSDERVRRDLQVAQLLSADDVSSQIINSQTNAITRELQNPGERTRERVQLISEFEKLAPPDFLVTQLVASLSANSEAAYSFWEGIIDSRREQFTEQTSAMLINKALELAGAAGSLNQRKPALLKVAISFFSSQPPAEQSALTRRVLELLWHPDDTIRDSTANTLSMLRAHVNQGDFRIYLNADIHEHLHKVGVSSLRQYQPVIDALVANKDLWNEGSSRSVAQLAVILSSDDNLKASVLTLLESVSQFDEADIQDVTHVLKAIESAQSGLSDRARNLLQRIPTEQQRD